MKIALIRPPKVRPYWFATKPSLGISYICSYLEVNNVECKIFDANFNSWTEEETVEAIMKYKPDLIGLSSMTHEILAAHNIASKIKLYLKNVPIVIGSCHITALPQETLYEFLDFTYGIYGEGENTVLELARCLQKGNLSELKDINGLVYRDNYGKVYVNPPRNRLSSSELDRLPYPAFNQYYQNKKALISRDDYYVMMASRGCPYSCIFCMRVLGNEVRRRSPESIINEIEYAIERYGAHTVFFLDEIFLFNDSLTYDTLQLIKKRNLPKHIRWKAATRVNFVNEKLVKSAKDAGCFFLEIGVESGSDKILKVINKQITVEQAEGAVEIIKKAGLGVEIGLILGHPNETRETIKETVGLVVKLNTDTVSVGLMTPYPGTKIYEMAKRGEGGYRLLTQDWSKYDKYGGKSLELEGLSIKELEKWQKKLLLYFYIKNFRFLDLIKFIIEYRRTIFDLLLKH